MIPLFVVEDAPATVEDVAADLRSVGWPVAPHDLGQAPAPAGPAVWQVVVGDADDVRAAVLAAVAGAGLVVRAEAEREQVDLLCDDLRRFGRLDHLVGDHARPALAPDQRALLDLLAEGWSLGNAATALHLSRRSADRRLAAARLVLGATTTGAAVTARRERLARLPRPAETT